MHIWPLRSHKPEGRITAVQWEVQKENCLQVSIAPVLRGVPRQVGAHLVEVFRKGLHGVTIGLKDGQSFIRQRCERRDPRSKNTRMRKEVLEWVQGLVSPPICLVCIQVPRGCAIWSWKVSGVRTECQGGDPPFHQTSMDSCGFWGSPWYDWIWANGK